MNGISFVATDSKLTGGDEVLQVRDHQLPFQTLVFGDTDARLLRD